MHLKDQMKVALKILDVSLAQPFGKLRLIKILLDPSLHSLRVLDINKNSWNFFPRGDNKYRQAGHISDQFNMA